MNQEFRFPPLCRTVLLLCILWITAALAAYGQGVKTVPGEIILYMQPGTPEADAKALADKVQPQSFVKLLLKDCYVIYLPQARKTDLDSASAVALLKQDARVRWVNVSPLFKPMQSAGGALKVEPNDPRYISGEQWNLKQINMPQAWVLQKGSLNVNVGWIDSGFFPGHEDAQGQFDPGSFDEADNDSDVTADGSGAEFDHGTHTSGVAIAKTNNGIGIAGICWENIRCVALKIQKKGNGNLDTPAILNSYAYLLANHVKLKVNCVNLSYGAAGADPNDVNDPQYVATKQLVDDGVLVIASSGNSGMDGNPTVTPSGYKHVISVSALNQAGKLANYSSFGKVEIAAPGGEQTAENDPGGILSLVNDTTKKYVFAQGTSDAAPHVTGVVGLMFSVPGVTPALVRDALFKSANHSGLGALPDAQYGYGILDAYAALARISIQATIETPDGLTPSGQSSDPTNILPPPVETFKPTMRFHLANVPLSNVVITVDGQQLSSSLISSSVESGNTTGVFPQYEIAFRYQFPTTAPFQHTVTITGTDPNTGNTSTDTRIFTITPHTIPSGISMISIPYLETAADSPTGAFRDAPQLLSPNATLYRWLNSQTTTTQGVTTVLGGYAAFGPGKTDVNATLRPLDTIPTLDRNTTLDIRPIGEGYFINAPAAIPVITFGTSFPTQAVKIPLHEGWNIIGDPYSFAVPFNATEVELPNGTRVPTAQAVDQKLILPHIYRFVGGDYTFQTLPDGALQPWEGHWVYVVPKNSATISSSSVISLIVTPTPINSTTGRAAKPANGTANVTRAAGAGSWTLRLEARTGTLSDANNYIGMTARATDGNDVTKVPKPPKPGNYVTLGIVRPNSPAGLYAQDLRPIGGAKEWDVLVATDQANSNVSLAWPDIRSLPKNYRLTLTDKVTGQTIDLRNQSSYQFNSGGNAGTRSFTITAKPTNSITGRPVFSNIVVNPSRPGNGRDAALYDIGYTVSSDVSVEISVMSYGGRQIAQIGTTRAATSGDNHVTWNGRDDAGRALPAGPYVLQLKAKTQDGEVTRVIRPLVITGR